MIRLGTLKRIVPEHGFGFIVDEGGMDWFFVRDGVRETVFERLRPGELLAFDREWTTRGPRATDVRFALFD